MKESKKEDYELMWSRPAQIKERRVRGELDLIVNELAKAEVKHPNWPNDNLYKQHAIIAEELGEVAKAVLQNEELEGNFFEIQQELRETAAMCLRMLINL